jgi:hypothetical protein
MFIQRYLTDVQYQSADATKLSAVDGLIARPPATARSRVTNGRLVAGVDGRSSDARRFRDVSRELEAGIGGVLTEADRVLIRQAAALTVQAERQQAAIVNGEAVDADELVRLANAVARTLAAVTRKQRRGQHNGPTLAEYLAGKKNTPAVLPAP